MFTPVGSQVTHLIFLAGVLPLAIGFIKGQKGTEASTSKSLKQLGALAGIVLIVSGIAIGAANYFKKRAAFPPIALSSRWQIAVET